MSPAEPSAQPALWPGRQPTLFSRLAQGCARLFGWTFVLAQLPLPRFVAAAAPHTSNLDFWPGLLFRWATRSPLRFIAKRELFRFPLGLFMRAVGGLPLDRHRSHNFVDQVAQLIQAEPEIMLVIAPEGTRQRTEHWKTGFYYMALQAGVPIGITVLDWGRRRFGVIHYLWPSGDIEADFTEIRAHLASVQGRTPEQAGPVLPKP